MSPWIVTCRSNRCRRCAAATAIRSLHSSTVSVSSSRGSASGTQSTASCRGSGGPVSAGRVSRIRASSPAMSLSSRSHSAAYSSRWPRRRYRLARDGSFAAARALRRRRGTPMIACAAPLQSSACRATWRVSSPPAGRRSNRCRSAVKLVARSANSACTEAGDHSGPAPTSSQSSSHRSLSPRTLANASIRRASVAVVGPVSGSPAGSSVPNSSSC